MRAYPELERFVMAQAEVYESALAELRSGLKRGHWMWYIFPQIIGLGISDMARHYAISSVAEAQAYLRHPLLGGRLRECVAALQDLTDMNIIDVLGGIDAVKLRSSLTLFAEVGGGALFNAALDRWYRGESDSATLAIIARG
jgi:uncharacterized protein (DUF1810 family)